MTFDKSYTHIYYTFLFLYYTIDYIWNFLISQFIHENQLKNQLKTMKHTLLLSSEISRTASVTPNTPVETHQSVIFTETIWWSYLFFDLIYDLVRTVTDKHMVLEPVSSNWYPTQSKTCYKVHWRNSNSIKLGSVYAIFCQSWCDNLRY